MIGIPGSRFSGSRDRILYLQLFQMEHSLEDVMVDVLDAVAVQVEVLQALEAVEHAGAERAQLVVVEEERAQRVQAAERARLELRELVETQVTEKI